MKQPVFSILAMALSIWACAGTPGAIWTSVPSVQKISTPNYTIQVEPLKDGAPFYVAFLLSIRNLSRHPLEVDWNNTRYLHKGEDLGVFVFRGIDPGSIQGAIPPDTVSAGKTFSKTISPLKTTAFLPRHEAPEPGRLGFEPGILPAGENSIRLALRQDDRQWQETLTVRLTTRTKNT